MLLERCSVQPPLRAVVNLTCDEGSTTFTDVLVFVAYSLVPTEIRVREKPRNEVALHFAS